MSADKLLDPHTASREELFARVSERAPWLSVDEVDRAVDGVKCAHVAMVPFPAPPEGLTDLQFALLVVETLSLLGLAITLALWWFA